ncbi:hypothetical protein IO404_001261 [Campylobacter lari]|nr:hypothetical protein [Campylobacter lari]
MINTYQVKIIENFCKDKFKKDTRTKDFSYLFGSKFRNLYQYRRSKVCQRYNINI